MREFGEPQLQSLVARIRRQQAVHGGGAAPRPVGSALAVFSPLLDLIRDFEARDRSVLGICLGSQLMARAFGGFGANVSKTAEFAPAFIAAGVGHMALGPNNLLDLLRKKGFSVERVEIPNSK